MALQGAQLGDGAIQDGVDWGFEFLEGGELVEWADETALKAVAGEVALGEEVEGVGAVRP